jgi:hypothetical protein
MKKTLPLIILLAATALILAVLTSTSPPDSFGPRAAVLMSLAGQEWQDARYPASAAHYLLAIVLSAYDTLHRSAIAFYLARTQDLIQDGRLQAAVDLCRRAVAISIDELSTDSLCQRIQAQVDSVPEPRPIK